ncbi:MAG: hypothetical protein KGZ82_06210 [Bacteroidales bacterium]|nr:hypothetical protein [Bacteroidales bacterium]
MKRIFVVGLMAMFLYSCGGAVKTETPQTEETKAAAVELTVGNFKEKAGEYVGKEIMIKGTADHICKGDGKKLFLISTEEEGRVKVTTGENMAAFNTEYEGYDFVVTGIVEESIVDEAYLQEWETEIKAGIEEEKHLGGGEPMTAEEKEAGKHEENSGLEQIAGYRQMMAEQGVSKLSFYSISCTSYEIVKE